jgi:hypothetical protein
VGDKIIFLPNGIDFFLEDEEGRRRYFEAKFAEAKKISEETGRPTGVAMHSGHIYFTDVQPESDCPACKAGTIRRRIP